MDKKYNIEYLNKTRKAIYLEVEASVAEDIDCAFQWAIAKIKQLEDENQRYKDIFEKINNWCKAYPKKNFIGKEFDLANHVLNGIQKLITQKAQEGK